MSTLTPNPSHRVAPFLAAAVLMASVLFACGAAGQVAAAQSSDSSSWAGVGELLVVKLSPDGKTTSTPYQHTELTVSSTKTVRVQVPMSSSGLKELGLGNKPPPVTNSEAHFTVDPNGTTTQNVRSNYSGQLPISVKPTYELNGKAISASDLDSTRHHLRKVYKSGTLEVSYSIANVTKAQTTVSFEGFNGKQVVDTITDPLPTVAEVKLTFPKDATSIDAPGATLATSTGGVKATWTLVEAPPLSGASHTISYSVHLNKVQVPAVTLEGEVIVPSSVPTGKVPQRAASALASVESQAEQGVGGGIKGGGKLSLGGVRSDLDGPSRSARAGLPAQKGSQKSKGSDAAKASSSLGQVQLNMGQLSNTQSTSNQNDQAAASTQLNSVGTTASAAVGGVGQEVAADSTQTSAQTSLLEAALAYGIGGLTDQISAHDAHLGNHAAAADTLLTSINNLVPLVQDLGSRITQHATDANTLDQLVGQLIADADAFPPAEQSTPAWITLAADLALAKAKADVVNSVAADLAQRESAIASALQQIRATAEALQQDAHNVSSEADALKSDVTGSIATAEQNFDSAVDGLSAKVGALQSQINAAQSQIGQAVSSAQSSLKADEQKAGEKVAAATQSAQSAVQQAVDNTQAALNNANAAYAQLDALAQIAQAHQLPGGNATGANVQNGAFVYRISHTT